MADVIVRGQDARGLPQRFKDMGDGTYAEVVSGGSVPSSLILYCIGAAGVASGSTSQIHWGRSGGTAPVQVGTDVTLDGSIDSKININAPGLYAIDFMGGLNTIGGNTAGSPITGAQCIIRLTGSQNGPLDNLVTPYAAGGEVGAVPQAHITQRFAAGDTIVCYIYFETLLEALSMTTNSTSVVACASIQARHNGMPITGSGIPASSFVQTVVPGTSFVISSTKPPTAAVPVNATASATVLGTFGRATVNVESIYTFLSVTRLAG